MGLLDWFTSTKRPDSDAAVCPASEVRERTLAVYRPTEPFHIVDGGHEGVMFGKL